MDPAITLPPLNVPALLRAYGLRPKKGLGQNFLVDEMALQRVAAAAEIQAGSSVLEIGPGLGSLTRYLAASAQRVVAVELDGALLPVLRHVLEPFTNVTIVQGDILALDPVELMGAEAFSVVANIPYYITSAVFRHLLAGSAYPSRAFHPAGSQETRGGAQTIVLTIQREVAARVCAQPGEMNLLALSVQVFGFPRVASRIPAGAFYPAPEVDSSVVRVDPYPEPVIPLERLELFFHLARAAFSQKRKTLRNSLASGLGWPAGRVVEVLQAAGIDPQRRAETVSLAEWRALTDLAVVNAA